MQVLPEWTTESLVRYCAGFARVDNTEFFRTGQEGWTEAYDPRYSIAFIDVLSDNTTNFYSYVRDNTFHNGFSPAVGVFSVDNLEVSGNVIHHTVYYGGLGGQV